MSNVIDIGEWKEKKPQIVWQCECGCQLYYILNVNGELQCSQCSKVIYVESE